LTVEVKLRFEFKFIHTWKSEPIKSYRRNWKTFIKSWTRRYYFKVDL